MKTIEINNNEVAVDDDSATKSKSRVAKIVIWHFLTIAETVSFFVGYNYFLQKVILSNRDCPSGSLACTSLSKFGDVINVLLLVVIEAIGVILITVGFTKGEQLKRSSLNSWLWIRGFLITTGILFLLISGFQAFCIYFFSYRSPGSMTQFKLF